MISILKRVWHLLPLPIRTQIANRIDRIYNGVDRIYDGFIDRKIGIDTRWERQLDKVDVARNKFKDSAFTKSTPYIHLQRLFKIYDINRYNSLMDIGCGSGRVVFYFASKGFVPAAGLDFLESNIEGAHENLVKSGYSGQDIKFYVADAALFDYDDYDLFFFGNPFGGETMAEVLSKIKASLDVNPRPICFLYYNPVCHELLLQSSFLKFVMSVERFKKPLYVYESV